MINIDLSDSAFYSQIEGIIKYYRNLLKSELTSEIESRVSENISNLSSFLDEVKSYSEKLEEDEKIETLYIEFKELLEVYQLAGKDDQLDFNEEDISKIIGESFADSEEENEADFS